jgi:hypothetical protein
MYTIVPGVTRAYAPSRQGSRALTGWLVCVLALVLTLASECAAIGPAGEAFDAPRLSTPPTIDGDISDPVWLEARMLDRPWYRPHEGVEAKDRTVIWIGWDDTALYIAFHAHSDPRKLRAEVVRRDADIESDDWVSIQLDPYLDRQTVYEFAVTPRGTQNDTTPSGPLSKVEWKGDWYAAARIVEDGWTAEMAIPFSVLAYRPDATRFGINFARYSAADLEMAMWADLGPTYDYTRMGVITGLALPTLPRSHPTILGYLLGSAEPNEAGGFRAGLDTKYQPHPNTTALLTVNPDFSTVQQSVDSIDFSYSQRRLPDSRPFFDEGRYNFALVNVRYSLFESRRNIGPIDGGLKYFGKMGRWTTAFLDAWRYDRRNDFLGHAIYEFGPYNGAGVFACRVTGEGPRNDVIAGNAMVGTAAKQLQFSYVDSALGDDDPVHRSAWRAETMLGGSHWMGSASFTDIQQGFDLRDGLVYEDDIRGPGGYIEWMNNQATGKLVESGIWYDWAEMHDHQGDLRFIERTAGGYVEFRRDMECSFWQSWYTRPPYDDNYHGVALTFGTRGVGRGISLSYRWGRRVGESYSLFSPEVRFHPLASLYLGIWQERLRLGEERETQTVATITYELSAERSLSGRWIGRDGFSNVSLAYRQAVRRGMDIYVIYGDPNADETVRRLALKLIIPI